MDENVEIHELTLDEIDANLAQAEEIAADLRARKATITGAQEAEARKASADRMARAKKFVAHVNAPPEEYAKARREFLSGE
jgi:hypothetical protein